MNRTQAENLAAVMRGMSPPKTPKWIRCYDSGPDGSADRYTVVFTRLQGKVPRGTCIYLGMNARPFHPQGIGMHGESPHAIDRPKYSHLGKRIRFEDLPEDCQRCVKQTYREIHPKEGV